MFDVQERPCLLKAALCSAALLWSCAGAAGVSSNDAATLAAAQSVTSGGRQTVDAFDAPAEKTPSAKPSLTTSGTRRSLVRRNEAEPASLMEKQSSKRGRTKAPEFGQCEWHGRNCKLGSKDCLSCQLTGLIQNGTGSVFNENVESGDFCVGTCHGGSACPARLQCKKGFFHPVAAFQCLDLTGRCCAPYVENAPWPPCDEENGGVVEHGKACTPKCNPGYTPSEKRVVCSGGGGGVPPQLGPATFECIPDDFEAEAS